jgi:hypothetical protein
MENGGNAFGVGCPMVLKFFFNMAFLIICIKVYRKGRRMSIER